MHRTVLKQMIDDNGLKQSWVARRVGITAPALNLIAHGKTLPTLRTAQRIAHLLNTTVDVLWPLEDDRPATGGGIRADGAAGKQTGKPTTRGESAPRGHS